MSRYYNCPECGHEININAIFASKGGSTKSEAKAASAAENGKKGGRPIAQYVVYKRAGDHHFQGTASECADHYLTYDNSDYSFKGETGFYTLWTRTAASAWRPTQVKSRANSKEKAAAGYLQKIARSLLEGEDRDWYMVPAGDWRQGDE